MRTCNALEFVKCRVDVVEANHAGIMHRERTHWKHSVVVPDFEVFVSRVKYSQRFQPFALFLECLCKQMRSLVAVGASQDWKAGTKPTFRFLCCAPLNCLPRALEEIWCRLRRTATPDAVP